jgi:phage head maturation protease
VLKVNDASPVTFPANPDTSVAKRSLENLENTEITEPTEQQEEFYDLFDIMQQI